MLLALDASTVLRQLIGKCDRHPTVYSLPAKGELLGRRRQSPSFGHAGSLRKTEGMDELAGVQQERVLRRSLAGGRENLQSIDSTPWWTVRLRYEIWVR